MTAPEPNIQREPPRLLLPMPRRRAAGLWVSVAVHAAILAVLWLKRDALIATPVAGDPRFGSASGGGGGGGGGQVTTYIIALPPVPPPDAVPTTVPPVITPPKVDVVPVQPAPVPPPVAVADTHAVATAANPAAGGVSPGAGTGAGSAGGSGGGEGGGTGTGNGTGSGPGSGGQGGGIRPPTLRGLIPPLGDRPPKELRGKTVKVLFSIAADGHVIRFETDPGISDAKYAKGFSEKMMGFRFTPARTMSGEAVASVMSIEFTLSN